MTPVDRSGWHDDGTSTPSTPLGVRPHAVHAAERTLVWWQLTEAHRAAGGRLRGPYPPLLGGRLPMANLEALGMVQKKSRLPGKSKGLVAWDSRPGQRGGGLAPSLSTVRE